MPEDPEGLRQVREWRKKMVEGWQGQTEAEIIHQLNETGRRFRERIEAEDHLQPPTEWPPARLPNL